MLIIHHVFRPDNSLQILEVGAQLPLHATALGKALLAHRPELVDSLLARGLPRLTQATLSTAAPLRKALEAVRENGWAAEREEAVIGESSIAAPIFDRRGDVAGAIGIAGPTEQLYTRREAQPAIVGHVREAAPRDHARPRRCAPLAASAGGEEAVRVGVPDGLGPVAQAGLREQVVDMALHGRLGDVQPKRDLGVREPGADQRDDLELAAVRPSGDGSGAAGGYDAGGGRGPAAAAARRDRARPARRRAARSASAIWARPASLVR